MSPAWPNRLKEGVRKADEAIASGEARNRLDRLVVLTQSF